MAEHPEEAESDGEGAPDQATSAAVSLALGRRSTPGRGSDKAIDAKAAAFLDEQTGLVRLQKEHLHEQRELQLAHLKVRRWKDRLSLALGGLGLTAGAVAAVGIGLMAWWAYNDHGLVVEAFSVPPDMAQKGLSGQVMASLLLDKITAMDAQAQSVRAANSYKNNWGDDIKVEIPETGVSIGELDRWLRQEIGHETHISGNVFRTPDGLSLAVRAGGQPGAAVAGDEGRLDAMIGRAAEAVYGATQPYRYSKYLEYQDRQPEALQVTRRLAESDVSREEKAWAYGQLCNLYGNIGDVPAAIATGRRAVQLNPNLSLAYMNLGDAEGYAGHDGAALQDYQRGRDVLPQSLAGIDPKAQDSYPLRLEEGRLDLLGDFRALEAIGAERTRRVDFQNGQAFGAALRAHARAAAHDATGARAMPLPPQVATDIALLRYATRLSSPTMPQFDEAMAADDWPQALAILDRTIAATESMGPFGPVVRRTYLEPRRALLLARLGRQAEAEAEAAIAGAPVDCYLCLRMRGAVAGAGGDAAGAQHWFAAALRQSPALPQAETEWGQLLLSRGDVDGAIAKLAAASAKSPHNADALEGWGEALLRKGDLTAAAGKFKAADAYAPRWGRNHLRWGEALLRAGHGREARVQFETARGLDLSRPDRAALGVFLAGTARRSQPAP